jgi:hypothetical protein
LWALKSRAARGELEVGDANPPATLLSKVGSEIKGWRTVRIGEIGRPSPIDVLGIRIAAASRS